MTLHEAFTDFCHDQPELVSPEAVRVGRNGSKVLRARALAYAAFSAGMRVGGAAMREEERRRVASKAK